MSITPLILGNGRSGLAVAKSLATLSLLRPELKIASPIWLKRGASLAAAKKEIEHPVLCITNPHSLHADAILEADQAGYDAIVCEKPVCVNLDQLKRLREVRTPTAVLHGYRQTWGLQTLRQMLQDNLFGELIAVEGRYWQSSTAERSLSKTKESSSKDWKDDPRLSGEFDVYLDLGTHWVDAVSFLMGAVPTHIQGWRSYVNAQSSHRDSHVQLSIEFPENVRALTSISKTVHGATNQFEIHLMGSKMSATWEFLKCDEIQIGEGRDRRIITRKGADFGSQQAPFHGMGWLEGYIEIASGLFAEVYQGEEPRYPSRYPKMSESLDILDSMLKAKWR